MKDNAESSNGKSGVAGSVLAGNWVSNVSGGNNNIGSLGRTRSDTNAGVLPRQSRRKPRPAFVSVIRNLFEIEERSKENILKVQGNVRKSKPSRAMSGSSENNDIDYDYFDFCLEYNKNGIELFDDEYYTVKSVINDMWRRDSKDLQHYHSVTLEYDNLLYMYVYKPYDYDNHTIVLKIPLEETDDAVDRFVVEVIKNADIRSNQIVNSVVKFLRDRKGSYRGIDTFVENGKTTVHDDGLFGTESKNIGGEGFGDSSGNSKANEGDARGIKAEENIRKSKATKNTEQFRVMWTLEDSVLSRSEVSAFYAKISEMKKQRYPNYKLSKDGEYIFEVGNKLIYSDGDYDYPEITKVIGFNSEYENETRDVKDVILDGEEEQSPMELSLAIIEAIKGEGFVTIANFENSRAYEREVRRGKRTDSRASNSRSGENVRKSIITGISQFKDMIMIYQK